MTSHLSTDATYINPGDTLVVEGVPPIPATLAEAVRRYSNSRLAGFTSWHPREQKMLILTRFGNSFQVHEVERPGGARRQLTFFDDNVIWAANPWISAQYDPIDGDFFVFSMDAGGDENNQSYRYDLQTGRVTQLTDGTARNSPGVWSNAGDRLVYGSTRRNGMDMDLYLIDPRVPESDRRLVELAGGGWIPLDWSPDDASLLVLEYVSVTQSHLWRLTVETGEIERLTPPPEGEEVAYWTAQWSRDGAGLYVLTDRDSEVLRLTYLDLASGEHRPLTAHVPWDVEGFALSPDGSQIVFSTNEAGISVLRLLDTATAEEHPLPPLPPGIVEGLRWHPNGEDVAFTFTSPRSPMDAWSLHVPSRTIERWTTSEMGGLPPATLAAPDLIHWTSFDGREISGFLFRPPAAFTGKRPVIVNIHGGPEGQFRPRFLDQDNYFINELGVALLYPNVRGSAGYGKTFLKLDNGYRRVDAYEDIRTLLDWIAAQPSLDAARVMVTGGSYGGHMTLAVATRYSDKIACALSVVGMSNLVTFLENTAPYRKDLRRVEYGDERDPEMRAFLEKIAPLNHVERIGKPLFVVQGANDPRVPRSESEQMVAEVRANDVPVWYLLALDEGHGFRKKSNQNFLFYATLLFVQEFLLA